MAAPLSVVILAAGFGSRMKSEKHKVLFTLAGVPMIQLVVEAARGLDPRRIVLVVGHGADQVRAATAHLDVEYVMQEQQLGTAHAFLQAAPLLEDGESDLLVLNGDGALLTSETLQRLRQARPEQGMALLTARVPDPTGLGRVLKDSAGLVERTVEHKDAGPEELLIDEIVVGTYLFDAQGFALARTLSSDNAAGEYYITDLIAAYRQAGLKVAAADTPADEYAGVNDRAQLAAAEQTVLGRIRDAWLRSGVTMHIPETVYIERDVVLAPDVTLEPGVVLRGKTRVGRGATVGAGSVLTDASVAEGEYVPALTRL